MPTMENAPIQSYQWLRPFIPKRMQPLLRGLRVHVDALLVEGFFVNVATAEVAQRLLDHVEGDLLGVTGEGLGHVDLAELLALALESDTPGHEVVYAASPDNIGGRDLRLAAYNGQMPGTLYRLRAGDTAAEATGGVITKSQ